VDLRDLFEGLDPESSVALADEIGNYLEASDTAVRVLDEISEIVADKLIAGISCFRVTIANHLVRICPYQGSMAYQG
jgi:hypothetical protein